MSSRVSMEFGSLGYESLDGQQDDAGNRFMMVSPELRTTMFDEQPYNPSQEHINNTKLEVERRGIYTTDKIRDGRIRKGLLQLSQDPDKITDYVYNGRMTNRLSNNGFGYALEGRLNSSHKWIRTHTILEPWDYFVQSREHIDPASMHGTRLQTVDIFPEMRVKVLCASGGRGSLQWLYGISRSLRLEEVIRITLIH